VLPEKIIACLLSVLCLFPAAAAYGQENKDLKACYEEIHRRPELGKQEFKTADFVRSKLKEFGYGSLLTVNGLPTAVIAVLDSKRPGPVICLRAELDARKCQEQTGLPFASTVAGVMHNCGHDAHTAILIECARRLLLEKSKLKGKIVFLFQPAEECAGGADDIVADGILTRLGVTSVFALHCAPGLAVGRNTICPGPALAGSNTLTIKLTGRGGHAAAPHERDDLPGLASLVTLELERLPARCLDVIKYPSVCSLSTSSWSSQQVNLAPDTITLAGTVRAFYGIDDRLFSGKTLRELISRLVEGLASAYDVKAEIKIKPGSPVTINDDKLWQQVKPLLAERGIKIEAAERGMFSDDFSYYTSLFPCNYFGLGIASGNSGNSNLHSAQFTISEDCLESGVQFFTTLAEALCSAGSPGAEL
jgi:N-acetylcysteine deacetylase